MSRILRGLSAVSLAVVMTLSTTAWAGARGGAGVVITFSGVEGNATGTMGVVRSSSDNLQYIGCTVLYNGTSVAMWCSARNASNVTVSCTSAAPELVQAAMALNSDAHVSFYWDAWGSCTALSTRADSRFAPKQP